MTRHVITTCMSWMVPGRSFLGGCSGGGQQLCPLRRLTRSFHYTEGAFQRAHGAPLFGWVLHVFLAADNRRDGRKLGSRFMKHDQTKDGGRSRPRLKEGGNLASGG